MAARGMAVVTRVAGDKEGNGEGTRGGGIMVAMGHGLCVCFFVCGETTKNKVGPKKGDGSLLEPKKTCTVQVF
jgi:hypothetical protein